MSSLAVYQDALVSYGRDAASRAVRQALQTLTPTLLVLAAGTSSGIDLEAVAWLTVITVIVSVAKSVAGFRFPPGASVPLQVAERAVTAAAGTLFGLLTVDGVEVVTGVDASTVFTAVLGSAVLAAVMFFTNPPGIPVAADVVQGEVVQD